MTDIATPVTDLAAFEEQLAGSLLIDADVQDLLFRQARTPQHFTDAPVSDATMRAIYDLVKWGPTGRNGQPLRVVLVRSPEARERVLRHVNLRNRPKADSAPLIALLAVEADNAEATSSALLQIGYFIVGVRAAGLAAGPMEGFDRDGIDREFFPDGRYRTLMLMNLGYATGAAYRPRQPRLDYDEVVSTV
ncbi:MAG TPA: nitroreductase family protein [Propionibacteriaceae bacterium]|nr:nitroreductase family protein [Propionibacteriaceae bacterium]